MDGSFNNWRDSPSAKNDQSILISDSDEDEDTVKNTEKEQIYVIESNESSLNASRNVTPEK